MKNPLRIPIRLKILVAVLFVVTASVSVITFTMANLFHEDKETYITDLASLIAVGTAEECRSMLAGYKERLHVYSRIIAKRDIPQEQRIELLEEFFEDFPELVVVGLYEDSEEAAAAYDVESLEAAGLSKQDVIDHRRGSPLPFDRILAGHTYVANAALSERLPAFTLAVAGPEGPEALEGPDAPPRITVAALIRADALLRLTRRSEVFDVFLADSDGRLLAHREVPRVVAGERAGVDARADLADRRWSAGITREFERDGTRMIAGYADAELGDVLAVAEIPKAAAYLASRNLLKRLVGVALVLLVLVALASELWARRVTRPVERLSAATRRIAKGEFDARVDAGSRDEIGMLADSFNRMALGLHERERALEEAHGQLIQSEKMAAFGQLGAGIAHEVKNPLAGILGCAQLARKKAGEDATLAKNLQLIEKETRRCKGIVENLLKFARQEKALKEPGDVNRMVEDAAAIVNHQLEMNQVKLIRDLEADLPEILANANQLQQVLMNLMVNAQHAMEGEGGQVTLSTRRAGAGHVEIRVADTGPGIPEGVVEKIFDPFFTTKPTGKGTGLGLSVSYGIVQDHGGRIRAESRPGEGATFVITLPTRRRLETAAGDAAETADREVAEAEIAADLEAEIDGRTAREDRDGVAWSPEAAAEPGNESRPTS